MTFLSLSNSAFIVSRQVLPSRLAPLTAGVCKAEEMEQNGVLTRTPSPILHDVELTKSLQRCSSHFSHLIPLFQHLGTFSSFPQGCGGALLCPVVGLLEPSGMFWNQPGQLHFSSQNSYWTLTEHSGTSWDRPSLPPETPAGTFQKVLEPALTSPQSPLSPAASTQAQAPNAAATEAKLCSILPSALTVDTTNTHPSHWLYAIFTMVSPPFTFSFVPIPQPKQVS